MSLKCYTRTFESKEIQSTPKLVIFSKIVGVRDILPPSPPPITYLLGAMNQTQPNLRQCEVHYRELPSLGL